MFKSNHDVSKADIAKNLFSKKANPVGNGLSGELLNTPAEAEVGLSGGLSLGETDNLAFTPAELGTLLNELLEEEKWNSARGLIRLYPDIVTKILIGDARGSVSPPQLLEVANLFDEQWGNAGSDTWLSLVQALQTDTREVSFAESRARFLNYLENDQPSKALGIRIDRTLEEIPSSIARAETFRLEGIAHMMLEHEQESLRCFSQATNLLKSSHPHTASQLALLLGESHRIAGDEDQWKSSWEFAIDIQSRWLAERGLHDPAFWKQAAYLRPASSPWPVKIIGRLENALRNENLDIGSDQTTDVEAVVWATVGTQSLKRHESQNAILAFKKSEALVASKHLKEELQIQQALAMINGGQQGPASAILLRLSSKPGLLGDRSKAILATMKLQNGSLVQGMNLLQSAIKTSNQWPTSERLRSLADYGLAYLMRGREEQGISLLNAVHSEFIKEKSFDHAAQCLANLATYYEKTDQMARHKEVVARMKRLEAQ